MRESRTSGSGSHLSRQRLCGSWQHRQSAPLSSIASEARPAFMRVLQAKNPPRYARHVAHRLRRSEPVRGVDERLVVPRPRDRPRSSHGDVRFWSERKRVLFSCATCAHARASTRSFHGPRCGGLSGSFTRRATRSRLVPHTRRSAPRTGACLRRRLPIRRE